MDVGRSFGGRPSGFVIDHTRPVFEVDISGGGDGPPKSFKRPRTDQDQPPENNEIPVAEVNVSGCSTGPHGGQPPPPPIPNAVYSLLDIPISTSKAVRVGCWSSSPIDLDALKGKIYPDFLHCLRPRQRPPSAVDMNSMQTLKDDLFRSPSDFPEMNNLLQTFLKRDNLGSSSKYPGITFSPPDDDDDDIGDGPFPSASLYEECSNIPKEAVDKILKIIEREKTFNSHVRDLKEHLKNNEIAFKSQYSYSTMEYRHCITAYGASCWKQASSGIMWAGVYGINDICVVTLTAGQHLDRKRVHGCLASVSPMFLLSLFRKCVLSELEDLADPTCKLGEEFNRSFDPPFCVVSETLPTVPDESGHEVSQQAYAAHNVPVALLEQTKNGGGAIKLAIYAFERLMGKKFEAKEIEVTALSGRKYGNGYFKDLDISEIGVYLAAVEAMA